MIIKQRVKWVCPKKSDLFAKRVQNLYIKLGNSFIEVPRLNDNHSLRLINKKYNTTKNTHFTYLIIAMIDKIVDIIRYTARELIKYNKKVTPESYEVLKLVHRSIDLFQTLFFKFSKELVFELSELKERANDAVVKAAKKIPEEEALMLEKMNHVLDLQRAMTEARMSTEF